jgi:hypothetical protein
MPVILLDIDPVEKLLEAGSEVLILAMTKGSLDEKGKKLHGTLREMTKVLALAKFDARLPRPVSGGAAPTEETPA